MPFTLAHPAAVLPLRRWTGRTFVWPALLIGTVCPDLLYFVRLRGGDPEAHTLLGSFTFCLPAGLVLLLFWEVALRRPVVLLLPAPHRHAAWAALQRAPLHTPRWLARAVLSVLVGAWSHVAWDLFTHDNPGVIARLPVLDDVVVRALGHSLRLFSALQYASSVAGLVLLAGAYARWLATAPRARDIEVPHVPRAVRTAALALLAIAPPIAAAWVAVTTTGGHGSELALLRAVVVQFLIGWVAAFGAVLVALSLGVSAFAFARAPRR